MLVNIISFVILPHTHLATQIHHSLRIIPPKCRETSHPHVTFPENFPSFQSIAKLSSSGLVSNEQHFIHTFDSIGGRGVIMGSIESSPNQFGAVTL